MSAPLKLTAEQLLNLASALVRFTDARTVCGVSISGYGQSEVQIGDVVLAVSWDDDRLEYVIDDRSGS